MKKIPKIFLYGSYRHNAGPDNVNRYLLDNSKHNILHEKSSNKFIKRLERLLYFSYSDVIVFSGFGKHKYWLKYAKLLGKKTIYLMHGCANYEDKINKLNLDTKLLDYEKVFLADVDLILPVSESYKEWVIQMFPATKNHIHFLNSGIELGDVLLTNEEKKLDSIQITVAGGDRIQKNNLDVAKAVEILSGYFTKKIELKVCGRKYLDGNVFEKYPHSKYMGMA